MPISLSLVEKSFEVHVEVFHIRIVRCEGKNQHFADSDLGDLFYLGVFKPRLHQYVSQK
jgi:hypothetical protein